ncbi:class I SAM-dependent DNA methyltransferase [Bacteroides sp. GM023]|nr:class I SAM-dependent DNA methyltransferase [Bacteroides sp. GM023]
MSIKCKIEAVGVPLKNWDIKINYGIKTGFNDAFIIDTNKREEILANCQTEDEKKRTAEIIRPILRGRDIKRYGYNWAEKYLIATYPSRHYDIEQYPAVKNYLLTFGIERLEQTGKTHIVNGEKVKARKKTNNKWFETQDSISYWEDFDKPKLIWKIIGSKLAFTVETKGHVVNNACYLMTGDYLNHILAFLNSPPLIWYSEITNMNKTGVGDAQVGAQNIIIFPIPKPSPQYNIVSDAAGELLKTFTKEKMEELQRIIYDIFEFTKDEIDYLNRQNL